MAGETVPSTASGTVPAKSGVGAHLALWTDVKCNDLVKGQKPVVVTSDMSVEQASEFLVKNGVSSCPVYDIEKKCFTGMFDYNDLVSYILVVFQKNELKEDEGKVEISEIVRRAIKLEPVAVKFVTDLSRKNPFYSVLPESSLLQAMDIFGKGIHRVLVLNGNGELNGILSQSTVADFLFKKLTSIPTSRKSLKELKLSKGKVFTINGESKVFDALTIMQSHGLSSLPMVDPQGHLLGSVSLSDIKYVLRGYHYHLLWRTCFQFIQHVRNNQGMENKGEDRYPVFDVKESDSLARAIGKMNATRAHRVWVVNDQNKLTGVVSLTDVLRALTPPDSDFNK